MKVVHITSGYPSGGSGEIAYALCDSLKQAGHTAELLVAESSHPEVTPIGRESKSTLLDEKIGPFLSYRLLWLCQKLGLYKHKGFARIVDKIHKWGYRPTRTWAHYKGREYFNFRGIWDWADSQEKFPDIIHCHDIMTGYFDLGILPKLSRKSKVVLTFHNAWYYTGLCHHAISCDRWKSGCGNCPQLHQFPQMHRDSTTENWEYKQDIYSQSSLNITSPAQWLLDNVEESMMAKHIESKRLIRHGVDLEVFRPAPKAEIREELNLSENAKILLFIGNRTLTNQWKSYDAMEHLYFALKPHFKESLLFVVVGEGNHQARGDEGVRFVTFIKDKKELVRYYQAADCYLHAAVMDTYPNVVMESMACGLPVIGSSVGGICEQIEYGKNGLLVDDWYSSEFTQEVQVLLENEQRLSKMSQYALETARRGFDGKQMRSDYLKYYQDLLNV